MPEKFTKAPVKMLVKDYFADKYVPQEVSGTVFGETGLGFVKLDGGDYKAVHTQSGMTLGEAFTKQRDVKAYLVELGELKADWTLPVDTLVNYTLPDGRSLAFAVAELRAKY
jgi:hypothetical protein